MPWHIEIHTDTAVIETSYSGQITPQELTEAAETTIKAAEVNGIVLLLADCSALEGGHSNVDLFWLADWLSAQPIGHKIREAIILPEQAMMSVNVEFWATICANRGVVVELFSNRPEAEAWLHSQKTQD